MTDTHIIYRGSDIHLPGLLQNADGSPINLTGAVVTLDQAPLLGATVTVTNAVGGAILIAAPWSSQWNDGRTLWFRLICDPGIATGFPQTWITIK